MPDSSEKQNQELEKIDQGYYRLEINKKNLVSAYESTRIESSSED